MFSLKPRVVIAGQIPPPYGGQNIMIQQALAQFDRASACEMVHLPFLFTSDVRQARAGSAAKLVELLRVIGRLLRIRLAGPIDLLLYPTGGPHRVPMIRDLLLLPWGLLCSRRLVLHFHAAGIADRFEARPPSLSRALRWLYGKAFAAVVMTEFNRRDPEAAGIKRILAVPHRIEDDYDPSLKSRGNPATTRMLYVGHLCADKGTPALLDAFASLAEKNPTLRLDLVGECLPPFSEEELGRQLDHRKIRHLVDVSGVLTGRKKKKAFAQSDLFIFPSVAPYESFGLVLVEAMKWGLPIVASDWRGNREVLSQAAGAICFETSPVTLTEDLEIALQNALGRQKEWIGWGRVNRQIFQERYDEKENPFWLADPILTLLEKRGT